MQDRHTNRKRYFKEQSMTVDKYVIPFISEVKPITPETTILEIGCGEGGNLVPFLEMGCNRIVGIDISEKKVNNAAAFFKEIPNGERIEFMCEDIYNSDPKELGQFDVLIMRDVIEHIYNQEKFMGFVKRFLKEDGVFFLGFPPWYNPFGGHQQMCKSKILSKTPYFHILPRPIYKAILKAFGEPERKINNLLATKDTGISIERFERILKTEGYRVPKKEYYFINPNYETKFGLQPRVSWGWIQAIPFFRNFVTTACYFVVGK